MPSGHQHRQIRIVDARTSMEHLVTDESVVAHRHAGRYLAVCGAQVLAASLTALQRSRCPVSAPTVGARLTNCPGCGQIEGVEQTSSTSRVDAWKCRCGMVWAISLVNHGQRPAYFDQLAATVEQLGATRSVLRAVITLADDAATLPDQELRDRLLALADRARLVR